MRQNPLIIVVVNVLMLMGKKFKLSKSIHVDIGVTLHKWSSFMHVQTHSLNLSHSQTECHRKVQILKPGNISVSAKLLVLFFVFSTVHLVLEMLTETLPGRFLKNG